MERLAGAEPATAFAGCDPFRAFAHLAFCARAIFRREAADIIRFGWFVFRDIPVPFNDSITVIAWSNFSRCNCARFAAPHEAAEARWLGLPLFPPSVFDSGSACGEHDEGTDHF